MEPNGIKNLAKKMVMIMKEVDHIEKNGLGIMLFFGLKLSQFNNGRFINIEGLI